MKKEGGGKREREYGTTIKGNAGPGMSSIVGPRTKGKTMAGQEKNWRAEAKRKR